MNPSPRDNFYRCMTLIVDNGNEAAWELLDYYLSKQGTTLKDFIEKNQHEIYHLCYNISPCCRCHYATVNKPKCRILFQTQLCVLLDTKGSNFPCFLHKHGKPTCSHTLNDNYANPNIATYQLDLTLCGCLLFNFTNMLPQGSVQRTAFEDLINMRNKCCHDAKGEISSKNYQTYKTQIEKCLLALAQVYGKTNNMQLKFKDAEKRPFDESICKQLQQTILQEQVLQGVSELHKHIESSQEAEERTTIEIQKIGKPTRRTLPMNLSLKLAGHTTKIQKLEDNTERTLQAVNHTDTKIQKLQENTQETLKAIEYTAVSVEKKLEESSKRTKQALDSSQQSTSTKIQKLEERLSKCETSKRSRLLDLLYQTDENSKLSKLKPEYQIIKSLIESQNKIFSLEKEVLDLAVINEMAMLCRWLLANFSYDDDCLTPVLSKSYEIGYNDVIKALSWKITREFYKRFKGSLKDKVVDIYPAYQCQCQSSIESKKCLLVSRKLIVIECIDESTLDIPDTFWNFIVSCFKNRKRNESSDTVQSEMKDILKKMSDLIKPHSYSMFLPKLNGNVASSLFQQHRNLSLICPSNMKSSGYSTQHTVVPSNACVQLFCHRKGIIPLGENHFPESVNGIPTDILQGQGQFASKKLRLGDKIGTTTHSGTLGGFYLHLGFKCFLTCAHVLLDMDVLKAPLGDDSHNMPVDVMIGNPQQICGRMFRRAFSSDDPNRTSIDAALVLIEEENFVIDQKDIIQDNNGVGFPFDSLGLGTEFVNYNFCPKSILYSTTNSKVSMVAPGAFSKIDAKDLHLNNIGIVAANVNGVQNSPLIMAYPAYVRCSSGSFPNKRQHIMYNQISMNVSLQEGDSGTCIYITQNASHNTGCIGMVHAVDSPSGISFVTPLEDIIQAMNRLS